MGINTIDIIYSDFRATNQAKPDYILDFFALHSIYFNNTNTFKDKEELRLYIELAWQYINAHYNKNHYNDTIDAVDKYQPIIDVEIDRLKASELKNEWYISMSFLKAMASYQLCDYKTATPIFKNLMQNAPKDDRYKKWFVYSQHGQRLWIANTMMIICGLLIAINIFFKSYITNYYLRQTIGSVGVLGLIAIWGYDYYIKRNFRKSKQG